MPNSNYNEFDTERFKESLSVNKQDTANEIHEEKDQIIQINQGKENIYYNPNNISNHNNDVIEPKFPLNKLFENIMRRINTESRELVVIHKNEINEDSENSEYYLNNFEKNDEEEIKENRKEERLKENKLREEIGNSKVNKEDQTEIFREELLEDIVDEKMQEESVHKEVQVQILQEKGDYRGFDSRLSDLDMDFNIPRENETLKLNHEDVSDRVNFELSQNANYNYLKNISEDNKKDENTMKLSRLDIESDSNKCEDKKTDENPNNHNLMLSNKEFMESEPKAGTFQFHKKFNIKEKNENSVNSDEINKEIEDSIINDSKKLFTEDIDKNINANTPTLESKEKGDDIQKESDNNRNMNPNEVSKIEHSKSHFLNEQNIEDNFNTIPYLINPDTSTNQNAIAHTDNKINLNTYHNETFVSTTTHPKHVSKERIPKNISYITDETFLQKIEEKELEKEKEVQQTLDEINQIESRLNLDERLMHEKWQIRKNAFKEISNLIRTFVEYTSTSADKQINSEEKLQMFETFSHWLNYFISDANITALGEGLNTFYVFIINAPEYRNKAMIDFFDEMEKIVSYHKPNINDTSTKIINFCLSNKKMLNFTINELIKKLSNNNNKILQFVGKIIFEFISNNTNESYTKLIFEKCLFHFSSLTVNKNIEKKKLFAKMIQDIFSIIEDDVESVKKNVKSINVKDLEKLLNGVKKKTSEKKIYLYGLPSTSQLSIQSGYDNRNYSTVDHNERRESRTKPIDVFDNSNYNSTGHHLENYNTINNEYASYINTNSNSNLPINPNFNKDLNSNIQSVIPHEVVDIFSVFPSDFFEIPYIPNFNTKKEILEKLNRSLSNVISIKDRERDHKEILSIINIAIQDSNIFVHLEGIKCLCHLSRLLEKNINQSKLKLVLSLCFDKFKDKKSLIKLELFNLFDCLIVYECFSLEYFTNFALQYASNQKVATVKQHILEYLKLIITKDEGYFQNKVMLREIIEDLEVNSYLSFSKHLVEIIQTEPQSNIKDICTDILIQCKLHAEISEESYDKFIKMMGSLPNYRSNLILSGNTSNSKDEVSEKEYKQNLGRIKSNLSRANVNSSRSRSKDVKLQKRNINSNNYPSDNVRSNPSINNQKQIKLNNNKRNSESESKNQVKENNLNINSKYHSNSNKKIMSVNSNFNYNSNNNTNYNSNSSVNKPKENEVMSRVKSKDKLKLESNLLKDNKRHSQKYQIPVNKISNESIQKIPQLDNNIKVINHSLKINLEQSENSSVNNTDRSITESSRVYSTNKSILEKRMESAIEHIYSLKKEELFEYTKKVIRDFLIFVQNVNNKNLNEDLESHFEVIFKILNKILERISKIFKNLIPDELMIQSIKVIVVASCFLNPEDTSFNKAKGETIRKFLERIRGFLKNDEKICAFFIDVINKFINFENNSTSFLENVNPKWVFINFIEYVRENIRINKLLCYENFVELIETVQNSNLLTEEEKRKFLIIEEFDKNDFINEKKLEDRDDNSELAQHCNQLESSLIRHIKNERENAEADKDDANTESHKDKQKINGKNRGVYNDVEIIGDDEHVNENESYEIASGSRERDDSNEGNPKIKNNDIENRNLLRKKSHSVEAANRDDKEKKDSNLQDFNYNSKIKLDIANIKISNNNNSNNKYNNIRQTNSESTTPYQLLLDNIEEKSKMDTIDFPNSNQPLEKETTQINSVENINLYTQQIDLIQNSHQEYSSNSNKVLNLPGDIIDIKDKIKQKMRKLDLTIQRLGNKIDKNQSQNPTINNGTSGITLEKDSENSLPASNKTRNNNVKTIRSLEDFYEEEKEEIEKNSIQSNNYIRNTKPSPDSSKQLTNQNTSILSNISSNSILQQNYSERKLIEPEFKSLMMKIPSNLLDNNLSEIILYVKLESIFSKISNESKLEFSQELSKVLENTNMIKASSFNCFLQLFEFILTLLTNEMKLSYRYIHTDSVKDPNKQRHQDIILKLQGTVENLLRIKDLTEIFKILVFLLKKYLPRDFSYKIDKDCLLYLKTICYLLKSAIEIKKNQNVKIRTYEILQEVNEMFLTCPPTMLKEGIPNLNDLDKIYKLLKILTDVSVQSSYEETKLFLNNSKKGINKSQYCEIYLNYLDNIINNSLDS